MWVKIENNDIHTINIFQVVRVECYFMTITFLGSRNSELGIIKCKNKEEAKQLVDIIVENYLFTDKIYSQVENLQIQQFQG